MVSLQCESTPWFHYDHPAPQEGYVATYASTLCPSYSCDLELITKTTGDSIVETAIQRYLQNEFVRQYLRSPLRYSSTDRYTLFLPINCPRMNEAIDMVESDGYSFLDRETRTFGASLRDEVLREHMSPYHILPEQIQNADTTIETTGGWFGISSYGNIRPDNKVEYYLAFPHATVYFISSER